MNLLDALEHRASRVTPEDPDGVLERARQQVDATRGGQRSQRWLVAAAVASIAAVGWAAVSLLDNDEVTVTGPDRIEEPVGPPEGDPAPGTPVTDAQARRGLDELVDTASVRTPEAMERVCELSSMDCYGMSGSIVHARDAHRSAPDPDQPPSILCSRSVGDTARLLVIEGDDGLGRSYVSHVVFDWIDDEIRLLGEPAFWLGVVYHGGIFTGGVSWTVTYHPQPEDSGPRRAPDTLMARARAACDMGS